MLSYYGDKISPHMAKTPEGYLLCYAVPINRTGTQLYTARELGLSGDPERPVTVYRLPEDVFAPAALASFEGKDVTQTHPPDNLTPETQAAYSKGHLENVRRVGDNTVADLMIKDPGLISDVENGVMREVSCGYLCTYVPYRDGYRQTNIIGNHLAVVPRGRAGATVAIQDAAEQSAEKGRKNMHEFWNSILTAFGRAAKDASPEELDAMAATTAVALDKVNGREAVRQGEPPKAARGWPGPEGPLGGKVNDAAGGREGPLGGAAPAEKAQEAEPAKDEAAEPAKEAAADEMVEKAPGGDDIGAKLDRILQMLEAKSRGGEGEHRLHDEGDLDDIIEKLAGGKEEEHSAAVLTGEDACTGGPARDAAVELLRRVRPAVAAIPDKQARARVTDALRSAVQGQDAMPGILQAAMDSARKNADQTKKTTYEQLCADAQGAYAARNPHLKKEEK